MLLSLCVLSVPGTTEAQAQPQTPSEGPVAGRFGLGAEAMLTGLTGATLIYDATPWRADLLLGYQANGDDSLAVAGRFFWVLHSSSAADFSVGPGVGLVHVANGKDDEDDDLQLHLEAAAQIRAFIVPNVALSGTLGAGAVLGNSDRLEIGGQLIGGAGLAYFF